MITRVSKVTKSSKTNYQTGLIGYLILPKKLSYWPRSLSTENCKKPEIFLINSNLIIYYSMKLNSEHEYQSYQSNWIFKDQLSNRLSRLLNTAKVAFLLVQIAINCPPVNNSTKKKPGIFILWLTNIVFCCSGWRRRRIHWQIGQIWWKSGKKRSGEMCPMRLVVKITSLFPRDRYF